MFLICSQWPMPSTLTRASCRKPPQAFPAFLRGGPRFAVVEVWAGRWARLGEAPPCGAFRNFATSTRVRVGKDRRMAKALHRSAFRNFCAVRARGARSAVMARMDLTGAVRARGSDIGQGIGFVWRSTRARARGQRGGVAISARYGRATGRSPRDG
jgi:hypothetical protein